MIKGLKRNIANGGHLHRPFREPTTRDDRTNWRVVMNGAPDNPQLPTRSEVDHQREPCPHRIVDDAGSAFAMGAVGGSIFQFFKGARNSPRGARLAGAIDAVKIKAPALGGSFAIWGLLYSSFDCGLQGIRRKEDPWNSIASGAMAGGILSVRNGARAVGRNAVVSGLLLALIEGMSIAITRYNVPPSPEEMQQMREEMERATREKALASDGLAGGGAWATADSQV